MHIPIIIQAGTTAAPSQIAADRNLKPVRAGRSIMTGFFLLDLVLRFRIGLNNICPENPEKA